MTASCFSLSNRLAPDYPQVDKGRRDAIEFYFRCDLADPSMTLLPDQRMGDRDGCVMASLARLRSAMRLAFRPHARTCCSQKDCDGCPQHLNKFNPHGAAKTGCALSGGQAMTNLCSTIDRCTKQKEQCNLTSDLRPGIAWNAELLDSAAR